MEWQNQQQAAPEQNPIPPQNQGAAQFVTLSIHDLFTLLGTINVATDNANQARASTRDLPKDAFKLPTFKGPEVGGPKVRPAVVLNFLERLDTYLNIYQGSLPDEATRLAAVSNCFPPGSRAATWWNNHRQHFVTVLDFRDAFKTYFGGTAADERRLQDRLHSFRQRDNDSVRTYHGNLLDLVSDLDAIARILRGDYARPVEEPLQRSKFVHGLRPNIKIEVERVYIRHPGLTLDDLLREAETEEKLRRVKPQQPATRPALNAVDADTKPTGQKSKFKCFYCRSNSHPHSECRKIAARKAAGTWEERPPRK